ncbi:hypothetical protein C5B92_08880 [Rathayibacter sp. AY1A4]|uniref:class III lanthionine synthetase LanKC n=1 Tax=Rathayibacter sp. AY1A4 TaxID=2080522 RepID=UPI000CE8AE4A|nr:class III lanthionine synthetase LanKC [Rathayibacter sp. AY1A4]PPF17390.1 hypothetical protein C5B92_08880 [Rathayibacter sp. AY1A4]
MPLDLEYLRYCRPGNPFYAVAEEGDDIDGDAFDVASFAPEDWQVRESRPWRNWMPDGRLLPRQGWKLHLSSTLDDAEKVLAAAARYCFASRLPFKHLSTTSHLLMQNGKYADRAGAGKFITVYPGSDDEFARALEDLDVRLRGFRGPYVLSDRRWKSGPVHFRYGAFVPSETESGFVSTVLDPDGNEVEDVRRPTFTPPPWASLPESVTVGAENEEEVAFGFTMLSALHFSNGGGVYLAEATTDEFVPIGTIVVLKEARPHAGLDADGVDAVTRLAHEEEVLVDLQSLDCVPVFYGSFTAWEHRYLVMEHIEGNDLKREWMTRTPLLRPAPWRVGDPAYTSWLTTTVARLDAALASVHRAGWLLGDIHPKNVIMQNGTHPCFLDFEFAHRMDPEWRCRQGAPGYEPLEGLKGTEADEWSLGILELDLLFPQATIADQGNVAKIEQLLRAAADDLAVPPAVLRSIRTSTLDVLPASGQRSIDEDVGRLAALSDDQLRGQIARGVASVLQWTDDSPVVPGDIPVLARDSADHRAGFPYGAAGVVAVLGRSGDVDLEAADHWLAARVAQVRSRGLCGREGIRYAARQAGLARTLEVLDRRLSAAPSGPTLWSGWAGAGLAELADGGDPSEAAHHLTTLLDEDVRGASVGLLHGWSAAAILFARLHEATGDDLYITLAIRAVDADLARCAITRNNTLEFDEGWRTLPYLGIGSTGPGLAILELRRVTGEELFADPLASIDAAASYQQCAQASLAHGLSGFLVYLRRRVLHRPSAELEEVLRSHVRSLRLHAVLDDTGVFFRGNQNLRLSSDYLTGSLGVLAALDELETGRSALPFGL